MICKNCQKNNITRAKFCRDCGTAFSEEQRQKAYERTIYGKIDKLEKWKGYITLDFITGNPIFKTLVLAAILVWGLLLGRPDGDRMMIQESEAYSVQQHATTGDYYVMAKQNSVSVSLYLPRKAESLQLQAMAGGKVAKEQSFAAEEQPHLECGAAEYYYIIADYGNDTERITVYLMRE